MLKQYNIRIINLYDILRLPVLIGSEIEEKLFYNNIDKELCNIFDETRYGYISEDYILNNSETSKGSVYMAFNLPIKKIQEISRSYAYNAQRFEEIYLILTQENDRNV